MFPDDATAEAWIAKIRWPDGPECPRCGCRNVQHPTAHKTMPYRCRRKGCRRFFSVRVGTVMQDSKLGYQEWAIATYVGGKAKNMHARQRAERITGRGAVDKTAVVGAKDRATNRITATVVSDTDKATRQGFVADHAVDGAMVYTDDHKAYQGLPRHETVQHSVAEYVRDQAHVNGIESFWAGLKRGYHGTFHHVSPEHLHRYVSEFAGRHSRRGLDAERMMERTVAGMIGRRLRYAELVAAGPAAAKRAAGDAGIPEGHPF